jgi:hypothetical protein
MDDWAMDNHYLEGALINHYANLATHNDNPYWPNQSTLEFPHYS